MPRAVQGQCVQAQTHSVRVLAWIVSRDKVTPCGGGGGCHGATHPHHKMLAEDQTAILSNKGAGQEGRVSDMEGRRDVWR